MLNSRLLLCISFILLVHSLSLCFVKPVLVFEKAVILFDQLLLFKSKNVSRTSC